MKQEINPKDTNRAIAFDVDEVAYADGDAHQDLRRDATAQGEPEARHEVQYAAVLVHRPGCIKD